jgi:hypothetical protein
MTKPAAPTINQKRLSENIFPGLFKDAGQDISAEKLDFRFFWLYIALVIE